MKTIRLDETPFQIGVFGSGTIEERTYRLAYDVGRAIARAGHIVISGGKGGVMEASSRGCAEAGGLVIGVLPGSAFDDGNPYSTVRVLTGMQFARNYITGLSCHGAIVVAGSSGAYEEARRVWEGRGPVVALVDSGSPTGAAATMLERQDRLGMAFPEDKPKPWRVFPAHSPQESVDKVIGLITRGYPRNEA